MSIPQTTNWRWQIQECGYQKSCLQIQDNSDGMQSFQCAQTKASKRRKTTSVFIDGFLTERWTISIPEGGYRSSVSPFASIAVGYNVRLHRGHWHRVVDNPQILKGRDSPSPAFQFAFMTINHHASSPSSNCYPNVTVGAAGCFPGMSLTPFNLLFTQYIITTQSYTTHKKYEHKQDVRPRKHEAYPR